MAKAAGNTDSTESELEHQQAGPGDGIHTDGDRGGDDWYRQGVEQLEAEYQKQIDELRDRHEGEIRRIRAEADRLVSQAQTQAVEEIELAQAGLKFRVKEYENRIAELKQELDALQSGRVEAAQVTSAAEDYSDIKKRISDQEESLRKTVQELTRYKQLSADLEKALQQSKEHLVLREQEMRNLVRRAEDAEEQAERFSDELERAGLQTRADIEKLREDSQKEIEKLTEQLRQSQERTYQEQLSEMKRDYEQQIQSLQSQLKETGRAREDELAAQICDLRRRLKEKEDEYSAGIEAVKRDYEGLSEQARQEEKRKIEALEKTISDAQESENMMVSELRRQLKDKEDLHSETVVQMRRELEQLQQELQISRQSTEKLERIAEEAQTRCTLLENQLSNSRQTEDEIRQELVLSGQQLESKAEHIKMLQQQLDESVPLHGQIVSDVKELHMQQLGAIDERLAKSANQQAEAAKVQLEQTRRFYQGFMTEFKELLDEQRNVFDRRIEQVQESFRQQIDAAADELHKELEAFKEYSRQGVNELRAEPVETEEEIEAVETGTCDCCGRTDMPVNELERISSGHLFCPACLAELRG